MPGSRLVYATRQSAGQPATPGRSTARPARHEDLRTDVRPHSTEHGSPQANRAREAQGMLTPPVSDLPVWLAPVWSHGIVVPFGAGLIACELFRRLRLSGLALLAGVCVTALLATELAQGPAFTSPLERVLWATLAAGAVGLLLQPLPYATRWMPWAAGVTAGLAAVWIGWSDLAGRPLWSALAHGLLAAAYAICVGAIITSASTSPERAGATGAGLGLAAGITMWLAGAAPLAYIPLAAGAACAGYLAAQILGNERVPCGTVLALPLAAACALAPAEAMLAGRLPWYQLLMLAIVPAVGLTPVSNRLPHALRCLALLAATLAVGAGATALQHFGIGRIVG